MSIEALSWALNRAPVTDPAAAAVLIALANHAQPDGTDCWPAIDRLCYYTRLSERTVRRHLRWLEDHGVIAQDHDTRGRDAKTRSDQRPTVYKLLMDGPGRETYEARRTRLRAEKNGGSQRPPVENAQVSTGGQGDRPVADGGSDSPARGVTVTGAGGHGDPRTVLDPPTDPTGVTHSGYDERDASPEPSPEITPTTDDDRPAAADVTPTAPELPTVPAAGDTADVVDQDLDAEGLPWRNCPAHRTTPALGPCPPCGDARRRREVAMDERARIRAARDQEQRAARRAAGALEAAELDSCSLCDEDGVPYDVDLRKCTHDGQSNLAAVEQRRATMAALRSAVGQRKAS